MAPLYGPGEFYPIQRLLDRSLPPIPTCYLPVFEDSAINVNPESFELQPDLPYGIKVQFRDSTNLQQLYNADAYVVMPIPIQQQHIGSVPVLCARVGEILTYNIRYLNGNISDIPSLYFNAVLGFGNVPGIDLKQK